MRKTWQNMKSAVKQTALWQTTIAINHPTFILKFQLNNSLSMMIMTCHLKWKLLWVVMRKMMLCCSIMLRECMDRKLLNENYHV